MYSIQNIFLLAAALIVLVSCNDKQLPDPVGTYYCLDTIHCGKDCFDGDIIEENLLQIRPDSTYLLKDLRADPYSNDCYGFLSDSGTWNIRQDTLILCPETPPLLAALGLRRHFSFLPGGLKEKRDWLKWPDEIVWKKQ